MNDEQIQVWLDRASDRGEARGRDDRDAGVYNDSPLSGEWAGESVPELLGDILERIGWDYWQETCEAYEYGYFLAFDDVDRVSVCADCAQVLVNGVCDGWEDSPDETRERPAGVFPYRIDMAWKTGSVSTFVKYPCECCGSRLAGERHTVLVWVSPDSESVTGA